MGWFIAGIIFVILAVIAVIWRGNVKRREAKDLALHEQRVADYEQRKAANSGRGSFYENAPREYDSDGPIMIKVLGAVAIGFGVLGVAFLPWDFFYTQDAGTAVVQVDVTGNIVGQTNETGVHTKTPFIYVVEFNIRNQQSVYAGDKQADYDNSGGIARGPQISVTDAEGVSSNIDLALLYSLKPSAVTKIYKEFKTEENFKAAFIEQRIRSAARLAPTQYKTLDLITKREKLGNDILEEIEDSWAKLGVIGVEISLQDIRPPQAITDSYAAAQTAQINITTEEAKLAAVKVSAQQQVVEAQAASDANALLTQSLTPEILQQRYIEAIKEGTTFVVPDGSVPFIGTK